MTKRKTKLPRDKSWATLNVSWDTYDYIMKKRERGESVNIVLRKILGLEVPDPTRPKSRRTLYYDEDY